MSKQQKLKVEKPWSDAESFERYLKKMKARYVRVGGSFRFTVPTMHIPTQQTLRSIYTWDINVTGRLFHDSYIDGKWVTELYFSD